MVNTLIVGAGGHGKVVLDILRAGGHYRPVGFVDADPRLVGTTVGGLPVLGGLHQLARLVGPHRVAAAVWPSATTGPGPGTRRRSRRRG